MAILFLGGILRVWGLGPRQHWVGLYWDHWVHWDGTEICAGSALGLQWEHWKLWHLSWECFGSFGPVVRRALELHSEPQDPYWGGYWEHWEYTCGPHRESCSLSLALYWKH